MTLAHMCIMCRRCTFCCCHPSVGHHERPALILNLQSDALGSCKPSELHASSVVLHRQGRATCDLPCWGGQSSMAESLIRLPFTTLVLAQLVAFVRVAEAQKCNTRAKYLHKRIVGLRHERHLSPHGSFLPLSVEARVRTPSGMSLYEVMPSLWGSLTLVIDCHTSCLAHMVAALCRAMPVGNLCCTRPTQAYSYHRRLLRAVGVF